MFLSNSPVYNHVNLCFSQQMRRRACLSVQCQVRQNAVVLGNNLSSLLWVVTVFSSSLHLQQVKTFLYYLHKIIQIKTALSFCMSQSKYTLHIRFITCLMCKHNTFVKIHKKVILWSRFLIRLLVLCWTDFSSFYNLLKNCRGHRGERSVFNERTEESSAVQYFQVCLNADIHMQSDLLINQHFVIC